MPPTRKPSTAAARQVLGVGGDATADEIRKAWRRKVLETHPDHNPDADSAAFREVQTAFETLNRAVDGRPPSKLYGKAAQHAAAYSPAATTNAEEGTSAAAAAPAADGPTPQLWFTTRTKWHLIYHAQRDCHGLRNAKHVFEETSRPRGLEPCPHCVPKQRPR